MADEDRPFTVPYAIGCDIGVTNVKAVRVSRSRTILEKRMIETNAATPDWPDAVARLIDALQAAHGPAEAIGIAAPGIAGADGQAIFWMQGRLQAVQELDWGQRLGRADGVPVLNDAQAALLGEAWHGAARGCRNVAMLTLGTGVGGALMVDGHLLRGAIGRAGHLGHISLDVAGPPDVTNCPGSLEHAIGNVTVAARTAGRFQTTHELIAASTRGDAAATEAWLLSVRALAAGVASLINVADPEVFIIGGGIARAGAVLFEPLAAYLDEFEWRPHGRRVRIVPAELGEFAGAVGAARNGLEATGNASA